MTPLFPSLFEEVLFWVTFLAGFIASALPFARVKKETPEKRDRSRSDSLVIGPLFLIILVVPTALGYARIGVLPDWLFYPGLAVLLIGAGFNIWGELTLGRFLNWQVQVLPDHNIVDKGPYRLIRHPNVYGPDRFFHRLGTGHAVVGCNISGPRSLRYPLWNSDSCRRETFGSRNSAIIMSST